MDAMDFVMHNPDPSISSQNALQSSSRPIVTSCPPPPVLSQGFRRADPSNLPLPQPQPSTQLPNLNFGASSLLSSSRISPPHPHPNRRPGPDFHFDPVYADSWNSPPGANIGGANSGGANPSISSSSSSNSQPPSYFGSFPSPWPPIPSLTSQLSVSAGHSSQTSGTRGSGTETHFTGVGASLASSSSAAGSGGSLLNYSTTYGESVPSPFSPHHAQGSHQEPFPIPYFGSRTTPAFPPLLPSLNASQAPNHQLSVMASYAIPAYHPPQRTSGLAPIPSAQQTQQSLTPRSQAAASTTSNNASSSSSSSSSTSAVVTQPTSAGNMASISDLSPPSTSGGHAAESASPARLQPNISTMADARHHSSRTSSLFGNPGESDSSAQNNPSSATIAEPDSDVRASSSAPASSSTTPPANMNASNPHHPPHFTRRRGGGLRAAPSARQQMADWDSDEDIDPVEEHIRFFDMLPAPGPPSGGHGAGGSHGTGAHGAHGSNMEEARLRAHQLLRGQMTNKRVASKSAIASLQSVDVSTLPESERTCVICYNEFGVANPEGINEAPLRLPSCKHIFGDHCIKKWFEEADSCPYCRTKVPSDPYFQPTQAMLQQFLASSYSRSQFMTYMRANGEARMGGGAEGADRHERQFQTGERRSPPLDASDTRRRTRPRHGSGSSSITRPGPNSWNGGIGSSNGRPISYPAPAPVPARPYVVSPEPFSSRPINYSQWGVGRVPSLPFPGNMDASMRGAPGPSPFTTSQPLGSVAHRGSSGPGYFYPGMPMDMGNGFSRHAPVEPPSMTHAPEVPPINHHSLSHPNSGPGWANP